MAATAFIWLSAGAFGIAPGSSYARGDMAAGVAGTAIALICGWLAWHVREGDPL